MAYIFNHLLTLIYTVFPITRGDDSCYFPWKQTVISRIISVFLNRDMQISTSDPVVLKFEHILVCTDVIRRDIFLFVCSVLLI